MAHTSRARVRPAAATLALCATVAPAARAQTTRRISVSSTGAQTNGGSFDPFPSSTGRFVAFFSAASNLVAADVNGDLDVFIVDRQTGQVTLASVNGSGAQGDDGAYDPVLSPDGRFVAFTSEASNWEPVPSNGRSDIFLRDLLAGTTTRVSVSSTGAQGNGDSEVACMSADARFIAFESQASNLVGGDTNLDRDIFVRDRQAGTTTRVSVDSSGAQGDNHSRLPSISADGRYVAFQSDATNLVAGDLNASQDIFVHDLQTGQTRLISVDSLGAQANDDSRDPVISGDGRFVAHYTLATNLVPGDTNGALDVIVHDLQTGAASRVSVGPAGAQANGNSRFPSISSDGRIVAFESGASNLVLGDTNTGQDIFVHDRHTGVTTRVNLSDAGAQGNSNCLEPLISGDGRFVGFWGAASNLVPGDTNGLVDAFVHDRDACPGDANGDGSVNFIDLNVVLSAFGACAGEPLYTAPADLNADGCVDFVDLNAVLAFFGGAC